MFMSLHPMSPHVLRNRAKEPPPKISETAIQIESVLLTKPFSQSGTTTVTADTETPSEIELHSSASGPRKEAVSHCYEFWGTAPYGKPGRVVHICNSRT